MRVLVFLMAMSLASATAAQVPTEAAPDARRQALVSAAREIMTSARYAALITVDAAGRPVARTMDAFPPGEDLVVWLATNPKSRKVAQIERDARVTLYYFETESPELGYVMLFGRARLVNDPAEKQKRWKDGWDAFWPDRGPSVLLIEITPERVELVSPGRGIDADPVTWAPVTIDLPVPRPVRE